MTPAEYEASLKPAPVTTPPTITTATADTQIQQNQTDAAKLGVKIPGVGDRTTTSSGPTPEATNTLRANGGTYQGMDGKTYYNYDSSPTATSTTTTPASTDPAVQRAAQRESDAVAFNKKQDDILNGVIPLTPGQQAQVAGLQQQFQTMIDQQNEQNKGATGVAQIRGYQTGAAEYSPDFQVKTIKAISDAGAAKVMDLQVKMASSVAELTSAFQDKNILAAKDAYDRLQTAQKDYDEALQKHVEDTQKAIKAAQDAKIAADKVTYDNVTKPIEEIAKQAGKNLADDATIQAIQNSKTVGEAMIAAGQYLHSENDILDAKYKRAQIDKIYSDIRNEGAGAFAGDPASALAYASEYAANGKIPTGMPKGSFGTVARIAKELPKSPGQILSVSTGVAPPADAELQKALGSLYSATELAKQLKDLDNLRWGGITAGVAGRLTGSQAQERYVGLRSQVIDLLSRARSGAALTAQEEARYAAMLPGRYDEPFGIGADSQIRIDNFIKALSDDMKNKASVQGWAMNGISTVKVGGQEYLVGDIIQNAQGQAGRVNPDGTITLQ